MRNAPAYTQLAHCGSHKNGSETAKNAPKVFSLEIVFTVYYDIVNYVFKKIHVHVYVQIVLYIIKTPCTQLHGLKIHKRTCTCTCACIHAHEQVTNTRGTYMFLNER